MVKKIKPPKGRKKAFINAKALAAMSGQSIEEVKEALHFFCKKGWMDSISTPEGGMMYAPKDHLLDLEIPK